MLLTISNSEPVSTGCIIANCFHAGTNHHHDTSFHMLIHTSQSQRKFLTKIKRIAIVKERFYAKKKNLQSKVTKIDVKEREQQMYV
jgi:hypothetical protein